MKHIFLLAHAGHEHTELDTITPWWRDQTTLFIVAIAGFIIIFGIAFYLQWRKNTDKKRTPEE
jgi:predicted negative regulator of RcsB-dependent stress response